MDKDYLKICESDILSQGYGIIPKIVMQDKTLDIGAKGLYAYLQSFCGGGKYFQSLKQIYEELNISRNTLLKYIQILEEKGYIFHEKNGQNLFAFCGTAGHNNIVYTNSIVNKVNNNKSTNTNIFSSNYIVKYSNLDNKKETLKEKRKVDADFKDNISQLEREVIDYMNELGQTKFLVTSSKTKSLLNARFKDGFTVDDMKDVIFYKYETWKKKPIQFKNGRMSDYYYKPTTLFSAGNFESYLQEYRNQLN